MKYLRKIFEILTKEQLTKLLGLQLVLVIVSLFEVIGIASIAPFMAVVSDPSIIEKNHFISGVYHFFNFQSTNSFIVFLGILILVVIAIGNSLTLFSTYYLTKQGTDIGRSISVRLYASYLRRPYLFHTLNNSSVLAKNIFQETIRVTNNIIVQFLMINAKAFSIVFISIGLFWVNPQVTISALVFLGACYILIYVFVKKRLFISGKSMSHLQGQAFKIVNEGLGAVKEVKLHHKENVYVKDYEKLMEVYGDLSVQTSVIPVVPRYLLEVAVFSGVILSITYSIIIGLSLSQILPMLSIFAMAGIKLMPALQQVFASIAIIRSTLFAFDLIYDDLVYIDQIKENKIINDDTLSLHNEIIFKDVHFSYPNATKEALAGLNLKIPAKKKIAFVGHSGSGKSTAVDILLGLLPIDQGNVTIDGRELNAHNLSNWQKNIGYVPQSVYLLDANFSQNVAFEFNLDQVDVEKVKNAISLSELSGVIAQKENGLNERLGERGVQLSGGQRQRIAIARALYHDASVLIFDEATSALDNNTENKIMESINHLSKNKTIVMVAHRLSTIKNCDIIYYFDNGRIIDSGSFEELLSRNTQFRFLASQ